MKKSVLAVGLAAALVSGMTMAHQAGDVLLRAGGALVVPKVSDNSSLFNFGVNSNAQFGLTATYMVTDNIGVELLAATPFSHEITAAVPAIDLPVTKVGKTKHLPPSLYLQYYFLNKDAKARPYVGAGLNYTTFFSEKGQGPVTELKLKDSWGAAFNAGVDIKLTDNLYLNAAMWYAKIKTKASFKVPTVTQNKVHEVDVKLDPMVYFLGVGYRF